jgi:hypothetical protein
VNPDAPEGLAVLASVCKLDHAEHSRNTVFFAVQQLINQ